MCRLALGGGRFLGHAQKGCLDERWEVTPIPAPKQKLREKAGKFSFLQSFASSTRSKSNWQFAIEMAIEQSTIRHLTKPH